MPKANLAGRFETRMWYITERVEPSRTKDIGGKFAVKKKNRTCRRVGPGGRVVITISPVPRLVFCSRSPFSSGRGRSESGLSLSGLVPPRLRRTGKVARRTPKAQISRVNSAIPSYMGPLRPESLVSLKNKMSGDRCISLVALSRFGYMFHFLETPSEGKVLSPVQQQRQSRIRPIFQKWFFCGQQQHPSEELPVAISQFGILYDNTISDDLFLTFQCYPRPGTRKSCVLRIYAFSEHLVDQSSAWAIYRTIDM